MVKGIGNKPPAPSRRTQDLRDVADNLDAAGKRNVAEAGAHMDAAGDAIREAGGHAAGAVANAAEATYEAGKGTLATAGGIGAAITGAAAAIVESVGDLAGAALQGLGKLFIGAGNGARELAERGGTQYTTFDIQGDKFAEQFSDMMFNASGELFDIAGKSYLESLGHLAGAGANTVMAAGKTLEAAGQTLAAAKDIGDAALIEVAETAVRLAEVAVDYAERGVDLAGSALQEAGKGLIAAGNAVNTARGDDTGVAVAGQKD